jgi:two-component system, NarL family, nitrate/nitrite response regulator NarL
VIADRQPIFRCGLRNLLHSNRTFRVIGEATDAFEAIDLVRRRKPDVLLLEPSLPKRSAVELLGDLKSLESPIRAVLMVRSVEKSLLVDALKAGASAIVPRESSARILNESIRTVMAGNYWLGAEGTAILVEAFRDLAAQSDGCVKAMSPIKLSPRDLQIIERIMAGCSNKEVGQELSMSERTVKYHLTSIFDRIGVHNRLELAVFAHNHSLLPTD